MHIDCSVSLNTNSAFRSRVTNSILANGETYLEVLAHKWITIRGFPFTNSVMEQYKQENKSTAKSKSSHETI